MLLVLFHVEAGLTPRLGVCMRPLGMNNKIAFCNFHLNACGRRDCLCKRASDHPALQFNPSRSDEDISAIGHRAIGKNTNFYSADKEKKLGKQLAQEVESSSKLVNDPVVTKYVNRIGQTIAQNFDARFPITKDPLASRWRNRLHHRIRSNKSVPARNPVTRDCRTLRQLFEANSKETR
jgi:hypothetical protein